MLRFGEVKNVLSFLKGTKTNKTDSETANEVFSNVLRYCLFEILKIMERVILLNL